MGRTKVTSTVIDTVSFIVSFSLNVKLTMAHSKLSVLTVILFYYEGTYHRGHTENMQTPHRKALSAFLSVPSLSHPFTSYSMRVY